MSQQDAKILRAAAKELRKNGWTQKTVGVANGPKCVLGAIAVAEGGRTVDGYSFDNARLVAALSVTTGFPMADLDDTWRWNDSPERTAKEVIAVLETAALIARDL